MKGDKALCMKAYQQHAVNSSEKTKKKKKNHKKQKCLLYNQTGRWEANGGRALVERSGHR